MIQYIVNEVGEKTGVIVPIELWEKINSKRKVKPCRTWKDVEKGSCDDLKLKDEVTEGFKQTDRGKGMTVCKDADDMFKKLEK